MESKVSITTSIGMFLFSIVSTIPYIQAIALLFSILASIYTIRKNKK